MNKPWLSVLGLAVIFWLIAGVASGQTPQSGPGTTAAGGLGLYNPQTVETLSGIAVSIPQTTGQEGFPEPSRMILETAQGKIPVVLGPAWFVEKQAVKIAVLDKIEVTGSRIILKGKPAIVAAEIKKGDQVLRLREKSGAPLWGQGRSK